MSEQPELSPNLQRLSAAIRAEAQPPRAIMCGFDLWLEVMASGHTSMRDFLPGGIPAKGDDSDGPLKIPIVVLGGRIVISLDPTVAPDQFYLKP